ncbi:UDP-4-amino-4,6-dideoxy-N-acetyl-beta-L-altrosamine transaminase [Neptuniibacter sp. QD48_55]|uniref:UDP-4-amino-4, 6-dideoxy-N-acetyl-beta-L-altrosamine transaminase n=1 Tax=Neptuniibacter sp. QD48_55 TaxID=3398212 RepID=UPI0039F4C841
MINYGRQNIDQSDIDAVVDTLKSSHLTQGPKVTEFEKKVSDLCNVKYAIATNSATSALHSACLALGLGSDDILWTTPITFVASANCAIHCGATVDFVDINPSTFNLCPKALAKKLKAAKRAGKLPKVVIVVHLCGEPCEMEKLHQLSITYGFKLIEDASHAVGAKYKNSQIGSCLYSDITVFSFHPVKIITSAEGGMAVTNDPELERKMRLVNCHGITRSPSLMAEDHEEPWYYEQISIGHNYRMSDIHAALGSSQIEKIEEFIDARIKIAQKYDNSLGRLGIKRQETSAQNRSAFHLYVVKVPKEKRLGLYQHLREQNIITNVHYIPVHLQPFYRNLGFKDGDFPNAEAYYSEALSLPIFPSLSVTEQDLIIKSIEHYLLSE